MTAQRIWVLRSIAPASQLHRHKSRGRGSAFQSQCETVWPVVSAVICNFRFSICCGKLRHFSPGSTPKSHSYTVFPSETGNSRKLVRLAEGFRIRRHSGLKCPRPLTSPQLRRFSRRILMGRARLVFEGRRTIFACHHLCQDAANEHDCEQGQTEAHDVQSVRSPRQPRRQIKSKNRSVHTNPPGFGQQPIWGLYAYLRSRSMAIGRERVINVADGRPHFQMISANFRVRRQRPRKPVHAAVLYTDSAHFLKGGKFSCECY
jgi:hypothetical protein